MPLSINTILGYGEERKPLKDWAEGELVECPLHWDAPLPDDPNAYMGKERYHFAEVKVDLLGRLSLICEQTKEVVYAQDSFIARRAPWTVFIEDKSDAIVRVMHNASHREDQIKFFHSLDLGWANWAHNALHIDKDEATKLRRSLPRAALIFDPRRPAGFLSVGTETEERYIYNTFTESPFLAKPLGPEPPAVDLEKDCPRIFSILLNVFGDRYLIDLHLNWHAFILQTRQKPKTAWLVTSEAQGVGKDLLMERVWRPIYGDNHVSVRFGSDIDKRFNNTDMSAWLVCYNEIFIAANPGQNANRREALKFKVTAPTITIEPKGIDAFDIANNMSFILHSNSKHSLFMDEYDRRFFVVRNNGARPLVEKGWYTTDTELEDEISREVEKMALYLRTLVIDENAANRAIETTAKKELIDRCLTTTALFKRALRDCRPELLELEDIFVTHNPEDVFEEQRNQEAIESISHWIEQQNAIPSSYMNRICEHHFGKGAAARGRKMLKAEGFVSKTIRDKDGEGTHKVWMVEI